MSFNSQNTPDRSNSWTHIMKQLLIKNKASVYGAAANLVVNFGYLWAVVVLCPAFFEYFDNVLLKGIPYYRFIQSCVTYALSGAAALCLAAVAFFSYQEIYGDSSEQ